MTGGPAVVPGTEPVVIIGAAGFIGSAVVATLRAAGHPVVAGWNSRPPADLAADDGVRPLRLRLAEDDLDAAFAGAAAVVHCGTGGADDLRRLLAAAARCGVPHVVYLSSIAVYGAATGRVTEDTPTVPPGADYAGTKAACEALLAASAAGGGPAATVLRPAIVYGRGSALWIDTPARRLAAGTIGDMGAAGSGTCNPVHVNDVAAAVAAAVAHPPEGLAAYTINGSERPSWNDYFAALAATLGLPLPQLAPATLRRQHLFGLPMKAAARLLPGLAARAALTPAASELRLFRLAADYPADAAQAALGWIPRVALAEGLADAVREGRP